MSRIVSSLLQSLCEGLVSYATYESRCGMGGALSERVFYPPAIRIANHLGWMSHVEYPLKAIKKPCGDFQRIDLRLDRRDTCVMVEVKWEPSPNGLWRIDLPDNEKDKFSSLTVDDLGERVSKVVCVQLVLGRLNLIANVRTRESRSIKGLRLRVGKTHPDGLEPFKSVLLGESALRYFANAYVVCEVGRDGALSSLQSS